MTALRLALIASVAALAGCSTSGTDDADAIVGPTTQAVARAYRQDPTIGRKNGFVQNAVNGERAVLAVLGGTPATPAAPATLGSARLLGGGSTPNLSLAEVTPQSMMAATGFTTGLTVREFGEGITAGGATTLDTDKTNLVTMDAEYARIAVATLAPANPGETEARAFVVSPLDPTAERNVPTAGTATYRGTFRGAVVAANPQAIDGDVTLNADFGAGEIDGTIAGSNDVNIALENGRINGGDYRGDARITDSGSAFTYASGSSPDRAVFRGGFFGPNAEESAGVVDFAGSRTAAGTGTTEPVDVYGAFITRKQ